MRVVWVHPSWRDLVVDQLAASPGERRAFLEAAELPGIELALSTAGGPHGERALPLLVADEDWDALADAVHRLSRELGSRGLDRLLAALAEALRAAPDDRAAGELTSVADLALTTVRRRFDQSAAVWDADALARWLALARRLPGSRDAPDLTATRAAVRPRSVDADDPASVRRLEAWLAVVAALAEDPDPAGLLDADRPLLIDFLRQLERRPGALGEPVVSALRRVADVQPQLAERGRRLLAQRRPPEPPAAEDLPLPPAPGPGPADRRRVRRVLLDL